MRNESNESLQKLLIMLEKQEFIEIIDDHDPINWVCWFRMKFLRETLY